MAMKERNYERWRNENEGPSGGPGARDDVSDHGRSSEYGSNFRDQSIYGSDRGRYGASDRHNEHYQGNDAGVPYRQNRYGQEDGGWYGGNAQRYGRDASFGRDANRDRWSSDNRYARDEGRIASDRWSGDSERWGNSNSHASSYQNRISGGAYGQYGTSRGSLPDYDSSLYGAGSTRSNEWPYDSRYSGQKDETMLQKVGRFFGIGPKGYKRSDTRIQEDVNDALMDDAFVDATRIEVLVKDAEVTLEGYVEDRDTKRRAEDVVCNVRGVKDCHNHLRIRPMSQANVDAAFATGDTTSSPNNGASANERSREKNRQSSVS